MLTLASPRLRLRTPTVVEYVDYRNRIATPDLPAITTAEAEALIGQQAALCDGTTTGWLSLGLTRAPDGGAVTGEAMIGEVGALFDKNRPRQADIGWSLHPSATGQGLATEAAGGLVGWLFDMRRLHRLTASCVAGNRASIAVMRRLGMRLEGLTRQSRRRLVDAEDLCGQSSEGERWDDEVHYGLLAADWRPDGHRVPR